MLSRRRSAGWPGTQPGAGAASFPPWLSRSRRRGHERFDVTRDPIASRPSARLPAPQGAVPAGRLAYGLV